MQDEFLFGLIGASLGHSFSAGYFSKRWLEEGLSGWRYELFELPQPGLIGPFLKRTRALGLNVTIPYKQEIIRHLGGLSEEAGSIGAVNVIFKTAGGWIGHNTDGPAFLKCLADFSVDPGQGSVLVLGTGGASLAVQWALRRAGLHYVTCGRSGGDISWNRLEAADLTGISLVINTTPIGMHPHPEDLPGIPYDLFMSGTDAIDLIYNPEKTRFLQAFEARGGKIMNGMKMLELQAEMSFEWWRSLMSTR